MFCVCNLPYNPDTDMLQCVNCAEWCAQPCSSVLLACKLNGWSHGCGTLPVACVRSTHSESNGPGSPTAQRGAVRPVWRELCAADRRLYKSIGCIVVVGVGVLRLCMAASASAPARTWPGRGPESASVLLHAVCHAAAESNQRCCMRCIIGPLWHPAPPRSSLCLQVPSGVPGNVFRGAAECWQWRQLDVPNLPAVWHRWPARAPRRVIHPAG